MKVGIIGYGWIGKATKKLFPDAQIYDKFIPEYSKPLENCDIAFLAVPTPWEGGKELNCDAVEDAIARETQIGLFDTRFYQVVQRRFEQQRDTWLHDFYQLRMAEPDAVFIGVGAAAKANTWLTWHGLNSTHLHCVTDSSAHKQGKYTPLSRIPIVDDAEFAQHDRPYALILSWNIGEGLKRAILNINPNTRFLTQ